MREQYKKTEEKYSESGIFTPSPDVEINESEPLKNLENEIRENIFENDATNNLLAKIKNNSIETVEINKDELALKYGELKQKLESQTEISPTELEEFLKLSKAYKERPERIAGEIKNLKAETKEISEELYIRKNQHWLKQAVLTEKEKIKALENEKSAKENKIRLLEEEMKSENINNPDRKQNAGLTEKSLLIRQLDGHIEKSFNIFSKLKNELSANEKLRDELNEEFVEKNIMPEITDLAENGAIRKDEIKKYANLALKLLKENAKYYKNPKHNVLQDQQINSEELYKMPDSIRDIFWKHKVINSGYDENGDYCETKKEQTHYEDFFELLVSQKKYEFAKNLTGKIKEIDILGEYKNLLVAKLEDKIILKNQDEEKNKPSGFDIAELDNETFRNIFTDEIFARWNSVKENKKIETLIGKEVFDEMEQKIIEKMKLEILGENRESMGLQIKYNLKNSEELFREAVISYVSSSNPHADDYGLKTLLDSRSGLNYKDAEKWFSGLKKKSPGIAFYLNECLLKKDCLRHNPNSLHKPVPSEILNGALKELPKLISSENDLRFKAKMPIKIAKHFISDVTYSDEKRRGMSEDMVKENLVILEEILKDERLREDFFGAVKNRGKVAEELNEIFTDQHFANSALLYDIITESSYKKVYFFNSDYINNPERYDFMEKDRIHDLNLSKFAEKISDPFRYSLSEEVFDKNFPKLKADINLAIKVSEQITDGKLADEVRERIVYSLMEPDLLDKENAMGLADKVHEKNLKEKLFDYIRNPKSKIERVMERITKDSRKNIENIENKLTADEIEKYIAELKNVESSYKISRNLPPEDVLDIFKNGRIKNTFDRGLSWQSLDNLKTRDSYERSLGTRATGSKKDRHPVAGALYSNNGLDEKKGAAPKYGSAFITLKVDSVKNRTYYVVGDSFLAYQSGNKEEFFLNLEDAKKAKALKNLDIKAARLGKNFFGDEDYVEAQILGGVMVGDIESINFRAEEAIIHAPEFEEIKKMAEKHNIKINIIEE